MTEGTNPRDTNDWQRYMPKKDDFGKIGHAEKRWAEGHFVDLKAESLTVDNPISNDHASTHTDGTDDIQSATAAQKGLMTAAYASKLDGIETGADVTDAGNVNPVEADPIVGAVSGIVKADGLGNISAASAGTDYLEPDGDGSGLSGVVTSEVDPIVGAVSGIVKADGIGNISAASAGTDYLEPDGDGSGLSGIVISETDPIVGAVTGIVKADGGGNISAAVEDTDYQGVLTEGAFADGDKTKLDGIETGADVTDADNVNAVEADPIVGAVTGIVKADGGGNISAAVSDTDYQSVPAEGAFANGDKTKLDGIETGADVTDAGNVNPVEADPIVGAISGVVKADGLGNIAAADITDLAAAGNWKVFYSDGTATITELSLGAAGDVLTSGGAAAAPTFETPDVVPTDITDLGANNWKVFYSNGAGAVTELALGADGDFLVSGGAAAAPTFETIYVEPGANTLSTATAAASSGDVLRLKAGTYTQSEAISITSKSLSILGAGQDVSIIECTGVNGIVVDTNDYDKVVTLKDFTITTTSAGTYTAIQLEGADSSGEIHRQFQVENITIKGSVQNDDYWYKGIVLIEGYHTSIMNCQIIGSGTSMTGMAYGIHLSAGVDLSACLGAGNPAAYCTGVGTGTSGHNAVIRIYGNFICLCEQGIGIEGNSEGVYVTNTEIVAADYGILWHTRGTNFMPELNVTGSHINTYMYGIQTINCNEAVITGNVIYKRDDSSDNYVAIDLTNGSYHTVTGNTLYVGTNSTGSDNGVVLGVTASTTYCTITGNSFQQFDGTDIWLKSNASYNTVSNNVGNGATYHIYDQGSNNYVFSTYPRNVMGPNVGIISEGDYIVYYDDDEDGSNYVHWRTGIPGTEGVDWTTRMALDGAGNLVVTEAVVPDTTGTGSLGTSSYKWNSTYSAYYYGSAGTEGVNLRTRTSGNWLSFDWSSPVLYFYVDGNNMGGINFTTDAIVDPP